MVQLTSMAATTDYCIVRSLCTTLKHYLQGQISLTIWLVLGRFAFLSATIPNAREFASWIAKTHRCSPLLHSVPGFVLMALHTTPPNR